MTTRTRALSCRILTALATVTLAVSAPAALRAQGTDTTKAKPAADNTKRNKEAGLTAMEQGKDSTSRRITQQIRRAVVADKSLSGYAHNVKIITNNGLVTLRGPVRSEQEKTTIESLAKGVEGVTQVTDQLTIAPEKPSN